MIATVTIEVRTIQMTDSIVFEKSTYFFSVKENGPIETNVGEVKALTGNQLIQVTYSLMSHTDLFTVDSSTGAIKTLQTLDKEDKEMYIINVEATDSRTATNTNTAKTTVLTRIYLAQTLNQTIFSRVTKCRLRLRQLLALIMLE